MSHKNEVKNHFVNCFMLSAWLVYQTNKKIRKFDQRDSYYCSILYKKKYIDIQKM